MTLVRRRGPSAPDFTKAPAADTTPVDIHAPAVGTYDVNYAATEATGFAAGFGKLQRGLDEGVEASDLAEPHGGDVLDIDPVVGPD